MAPYKDPIRWLVVGLRLMAFTAVLLTAGRAAAVPCGTNCYKHCRRMFLGRWVGNPLCEANCNFERAEQCARDAFRNRPRTYRLWFEKAPDSGAIYMVLTFFEGPQAICALSSWGMYQFFTPYSEEPTPRERPSFASIAADRRNTGTCIWPSGLMLRNKDEAAVYFTTSTITYCHVPTHEMVGRLGGWGRVIVIETNPGADRTFEGTCPAGLEP